MLERCVNGPYQQAVLHVVQYTYSLTACTIYTTIPQFMGYKACRSSVSVTSYIHTCCFEVQDLNFCWSARDSEGSTIYIGELPFAVKSAFIVLPERFGAPGYHGKALEARCRREPSRIQSCHMR